MARVYLGNWRGLEAQGPGYKQQAPTCRHQPESLTRDLNGVIGYPRGKKYEGK